MVALVLAGIQSHGGLCGASYMWSLKLLQSGCYWDCFRTQHWFSQLVAMKVRDPATGYGIRLVTKHSLSTCLDLGIMEMSLKLGFFCFGSGFGVNDQDHVLFYDHAPVFPRIGSRPLFSLCTVGDVQPSFLPSLVWYFLLQYQVQWLPLSFVDLLKVFCHQKQLRLMFLCTGKDNPCGKDSSNLPSHGTSPQHTSSCLFVDYSQEEVKVCLHFPSRQDIKLRPNI